MADNELGASAIPDEARPARGSSGPPHATEVRFVLPFGIPAFVFAVASLATCYAGIATAYLLGFDYLDMNAHVQAVLMWGFALRSGGTAGCTTTTCLWRLPPLRPPF
jgi:hypothetical protein